MLDVHPQYITDTAGKKLVVLPLDEFENIMEELEELEDIRLLEASHLGRSRLTTKDK